MKYLHEIICIIISISSFLLATLPISTLQNYLPFFSSYEYELWYSKSGYEKIAITDLYIDGKSTKSGQKFSINKKINMKINYCYNGNFNKKEEKELSFDPHTYFKTKAENTKLDEFVSRSFYQIYVNDLILTKDD